MRRPGGPEEPAVYLTTGSVSRQGRLYRIRASLLSDGRQLLLGLPLTATDATLARLVEIELLVTAAALLLAVVVGLVAGEPRPSSSDRSRERG